MIVFYYIHTIYGRVVNDLLYLLCESFKHYEKCYMVVT